MITRHARNVNFEISKRNDMHFVYAFFFENGDNVHVKVGETTTPYRRLATVAYGSPFPISQAVYCHAGSKSVARTFEETVRKALGYARTRGEWYVFRKDDGSAFRTAIAVAFAKSTGRILKWSKMDLDQFEKENAEAAAKWHGRTFHAKA